MKRPRLRDSDRGYGARKARDRAMVLPVVGLVLLLPPVAAIFQIDTRIGGVPFTALYLFGVWGLLIAGAALLSRRMRDAEPTEAGQGTASEPADVPERPLAD